MHRYRSKQRSVVSKHTTQRGIGAHNVVRGIGVHNAVWESAITMNFCLEVSSVKMYVGIAKIAKTARSSSSRLTYQPRGPMPPQRWQRGRRQSS